MKHPILLDIKGDGGILLVLLAVVVLTGTIAFVDNQRARWESFARLNQCTVVSPKDINSIPNTDPPPRVEWVCADGKHYWR